MNAEDMEVRHRIAALVESVKDDRLKSHQLFQYVWTMICVRRGLMRVVREVGANGATHLLLEEVRSGERRLVARPAGLDADIEGLAVQALTRILNQAGRVG